MEKIIISPAKYVQKEGAIATIAEYVRPLGENPLFIADDFVMGITKDKIESSYAVSSGILHFENFNGEASKNEVKRIGERIKADKIDCVVGIGGGKTLDTAKAVSYYSKIPVVIVPTIASTDAPCSALTVLYTDEGVFDEYLFLPHNPDLVLVDTEIIAQAPARLLTAGMGDALATYFEARACKRSNAKAMAGAQSTKAAMALAELCFETLLESGTAARLSAENKVVTKALEDIVEANTYLSGIGFESGGLAAAHAIHNGMTVIEEMHHLYHGEKVAFGTITQLVLENAPQEELYTVINFCKEQGLPTTFAELGAENVAQEKWLEVAELACSEGETIYNMPFEVTPQDVYAALLTADKLGSAF